MQQWHQKPLSSSACLCALRTVQVRLIHNLRLDDLLDDVLQGDDAHHFVEGVSLAFAVHPLHHSQVGLACGQQRGGGKGAS